MWADNLPGLLALRSVYTIDLLGEPGLSIQDRPLETDADQAAWLHEVIAQLPEPAVHVVGLSIGGWTAMNLAVHRPQKIASLTLIEPVFVFTSMSVEAILRSIPASVPWLPRKLRDDFNSWTAGGAPVEHEPVGDMIEAGMAAYRLKLPVPGADRPGEDRGAADCRCWSSSPAARRCTTAQAAAAEARRLLPSGDGAGLCRRVARHQRRASRARLRPMSPRTWPIRAHDALVGRAARLDDGQCRQMGTAKLAGCLQ